jgi:phage shock protein E
MRWTRTFSCFAAALLAACSPDQADRGAELDAPAGNQATSSRSTPPGDAAVGRRVATDGGASYVDVSVAELQAMLSSKNFPLINVHVPFEGDLPGTDQSIPFDQIERHLAELPADRDAPIVLYCKSGRMSTTAARALAGLGYTNVHNLSGGFNAWTAAGLPLTGR